MKRRVDADSIYQQLRADIIDGKLPVGTPMREVAIAERFSVSRTPVREALRRMQHERLLEPASRGLRVRVPQPEEVVQIYDLRILLEAEAAAQAAKARNDVDLATLEGLLARDRALAEPDNTARATANVRFHEAMWQASHNPVLVDLLHRLPIHLVNTKQSTLSSPGRWDEALEEHAELLTAITARKEKAAREVTARHLRKARDIRLTMLREAAGDLTT
jgi:DNA-binding GntR family transcriptional regulator